MSEELLSGDVTKHSCCSSLHHTETMVATPEGSSRIEPALEPELCLPWVNDITSLTSSFLIYKKRIILRLQHCFQG